MGSYNFSITLIDGTFMKLDGADMDLYADIFEFTASSGEVYYFPVSQVARVVRSSGR